MVTRATLYQIVHKNIRCLDCTTLALTSDQEKLRCTQVQAYIYTHTICYMETCYLLVLGIHDCRER